MHALRRGITVALAMATVAGVLSGCTDAGATPVETDAAVLETQSETEADLAPVLSDEEALQIAVETYEEFLAEGGRLLNSRGATISDVESITTVNMRENNESALEEAQTHEYTTEGEIPVVKSQLQSADGNRIDAYVCIDLSESQTFGPDGEPVGPDRTGLTHAFDISILFEDGRYKVDRSDLWTQPDFCA